MVDMSAHHEMYSIVTVLLSFAWWCPLFSTPSLLEPLQTATPPPLGTYREWSNSGIL